MNVKLVGITRPLVLNEDGSEMSAEQFIVYCARVSNPSNQLNMVTAERLLTYCIKNKHWSIFEQASMTRSMFCAIALSPSVALPSRALRSALSISRLVPVRIAPASASPSRYNAKSSSSFVANVAKSVSSASNCAESVASSVKLLIAVSVEATTARSFCHGIECLFRAHHPQILHGQQQPVDVAAQALHAHRFHRQRLVMGEGAVERTHVPDRERADEQAERENEAEADEDARLDRQKSRHVRQHPPAPSVQPSASFTRVIATTGLRPS
ncbi:MAG: hypothetical protein HC888_11870 [Candidatus Competibacteraceae bacterium]|nr:hypothetical protein [Candidatus Competibacteraceae bacterium]